MLCQHLLSAVESPNKYRYIIYIGKFIVHMQCYHQLIPYLPPHVSNAKSGKTVVFPPYDIPLFLICMHLKSLALTLVCLIDGLPNQAMHWQWLGRV